MSYRRAIHAPHGFVIVCGPTGSGKTTTLYATLAERNVESSNLCSVEDPVELRIPGVTQVQVNGRAGLTFPVALRSFLRQDPNVVMIGEMRDAETASAAVSASLSGQLVLTTLHSNDASRAIERLCELGVERQAVAACLSAIVSQRLVRRLCAECREWRALDTETLRAIAIAPAQSFGAVGCPRCDGTGYRGRIGVFEFLEFGNSLRDALARGAASVQIERLARQGEYRPMLVDGIDKALSGETSFEELRRVVIAGDAA